MLAELKREAHAANMLLPQYGLIHLTWGNASVLDPDKGILAIKPSGVSYDVLEPRDMVLVDLDGKTVEGELKPSSDTPTHVRLYRAFPSIRGVVHTHSKFATAFAQAGRPIPCYGTTHADYFYGDVPVTRKLTREEVEGAYEWQTGEVIAECFASLNPEEYPGVLVHSHGPFAWGTSGAKAAENASVLEMLAEMALYSLQLAPDLHPVDQFLLDKHYKRKHGKDAYYGQR